MTPAESSLWSFSLRVYAARGVTDACLWLQDKRGLDVNLLLFCVWAGLSRGELEDETVAEARELAGDWSRRVVCRLRAVRRELASDDYPKLRSEVQRVELAAEKVVQELLEALALRSPALDQPRATALRSARANLACYLDHEGVSHDPEVEARLAAVLSAALGGAPTSPG